MIAATRRHAEGRVQVEHRTFERLLVPLDFTPASLGAMRYAAAIAERHGSGTWLLHVLEEHPMAMGEAAMLLTKTKAELEGESHERLERLARHHGIGHAVKVLVSSGNPTREIVRAAEMIQADLIVLGATRRSAFGRVFVGSTGKRVASRARCPVLIVPCVEARHERAPEGRIELGERYRRVLQRT